MTTNKAQKRAIRVRMTKTGERYSTARHFALELHRVEASPSVEETVVAPSLPPRVAEPGMSDAAIYRGSGRTWDEWFALLDAWSAADKGHTAIARYISTELGVDGWWAQNVTVGYERARGLRAVNQRPDGFSVNASRTFPVSVERLFEVMTQQPEPDVLRLRSQQLNRSARFDVLDSNTRVSATFIARGADKASVQFQQTGLPDTEAVAEWRATWRAYLDRVGQALR